MKKIFYDSYDEDNPDRSSEVTLAWPKKGQRLLQPPTGSTPKEVSAHLDWLKAFNREDLGMPEAYKQGGDYLIEALKQGGDGSHPDRFVFPILYFYRHATELRLKQLIHLGVKLGLEEQSEKLDAILKEHALYPLWHRTRGIFEAYWPNGNKSELSAAETMIQELHQTDKDGQHLRYAASKEGHRYEHKLPEQLDLLHLRSMFKGLWYFLDGGYSGLLDAESNMPDSHDY